MIDATQWQRCTKDGGLYPVEFFAIKQEKYRGEGEHAHPHDPRRDTICKGCRQTARDEYKRKNRFNQKIHDTRRRHAAKFKMTMKELEALGWISSRMVHEAQHVYDNGCPVCGRSFSTMGHGLRDLTLDIIVPNAPKIYGANTRWICSTCNSKKSQTNIADQANEKLGWMLWEKHQLEMEHNPMFDLPLFSGFESQPMFNWKGQHIASMPL